MNTRIHQTFESHIVHITLVQIVQNLGIITEKCQLKHFIMGNFLMRILNCMNRAPDLDRSDISL
jgi:hypothetical protein